MRSRNIRTSTGGIGTGLAALAAAFFRFALLPPPNQWGTPFQVASYMRGTITAVTSSLLGPFTAVDPACPTPPANLMTLDGTFYVDPSGQPWMVCAHEWPQTIDGTMEAIRLTPDLSHTIGDPVLLFTASDASWITEEIPAGVPNQLAPYITDDPSSPAPPRLPAHAVVDVREERGRQGRDDQRLVTYRPTPPRSRAASRGRGSSTGRCSAGTAVTACSSTRSTAG